MYSLLVEESPWLILGDFNATVHESESVNGGGGD